MALNDDDFLNSLPRTESGEFDYAAMTDEQLDIISRGEKKHEEDPKGDERLGQMDRTALSRQAETGRDDSWAQALTAKTAGSVLFGDIEKVKYESRDKALMSLADGSAYNRGVEMFGRSVDPDLKDFKASGDGDSFWSELGKELTQTAEAIPLAGYAVKKARGLVRKATNTSACDELIDAARDAGFSNDDIEYAIEQSGGEPGALQNILGQAAFDELKRFGKNRTDAKKTLKDNPEDWIDKIVQGAIQNSGYTANFALGGAVAKAAGLTGAAAAVVGGALPAASSASSRFSELTTQDYSTDENGDLVLGGEADDAGRAFGKSVKGGILEAAVESGTDAVLGTLLKGSGWALAKTGIGRSVANLVKSGKKKLLKTDVGHAVGEYLSEFGKLADATQIHSMPVEVLEEDIQSFIDDVIGIGLKDSEDKGFAANLREAHKNGILNAQGQWDTFLGLVGTMGAQGGAAMARTYHAISKGKKDFDTAMTELGVSPDVVKNAGAEVRGLVMQFLDETVGEDLGGDIKGSEVYQARSDGKKVQVRKQRYARTEEGIAQFFRDQKEALPERVQNGVSAILKDMVSNDNFSGWNAQVDDSDEGVFSVPTGEDGNPKWDGNVLKDEGSGVTIEKVSGSGDADTLYNVYDGKGRYAVAYGVDDAYEKATRLSRLNVKNAKMREFKRQTLQQMVDSGFAKGIPVMSFDDMGQAIDYFGDDLAKAKDFNFLNHSFVTKDPGTGQDTAYFILDNLESPDQMRQKITHEIGVHIGIDKAFKKRESRNAFLKEAFKSGWNDLQKGLKKSKADDGARAAAEKEFFRQAEETLAWYSEKHRKDPGMLGNAIHLVRQLGRRMGMDLDYTDDEMSVMIGDWMRNMQPAAEDSAPRINREAPPSAETSVNEESSKPEVTPVRDESEKRDEQKKPEEENREDPPKPEETKKPEEAAKPEEPAKPEGEEEKLPYSVLKDEPDNVQRWFDSIIPRMIADKSIPPDGVRKFIEDEIKDAEELVEWYKERGIHKDDVFGSQATKNNLEALRKYLEMLDAKSEDEAEEPFEPPSDEDDRGREESLDKDISGRTLEAKNDFDNAVSADEAAARDMEEREAEEDERDFEESQNLDIENRPDPAAIPEDATPLQVIELTQDLPEKERKEVREWQFTGMEAKRTAFADAIVESLEKPTRYAELRDAIKAAENKIDPTKRAGRGVAMVGKDQVERIKAAIEKAKERAKELLAAEQKNRGRNSAVASYGIDGYVADTQDIIGGNVLALGFAKGLIHAPNNLGRYITALKRWRKSKNGKLGRNAPDRKSYKIENDPLLGDWIDGIAESDDDGLLDFLFGKGWRQQTDARGDNDWGEDFFYDLGAPTLFNGSNHDEVADYFVSVYNKYKEWRKQHRGDIDRDRDEALLREDEERDIYLEHEDRVAYDKVFADANGLVEAAHEMRFYPLTREALMDAFPGDVIHFGSAQFVFDSYDPETDTLKVHQDELGERHDFVLDTKGEFVYQEVQNGQADVGGDEEERDDAGTGVPQGEENGGRGAPSGDAGEVSEEAVAKRIAGALDIEGLSVSPVKREIKNGARAGTTATVYQISGPKGSSNLVKEKLEQRLGHPVKGYYGKYSVWDNEVPVFFGEKTQEEVRPKRLSAEEKEAKRKEESSKAFDALSDDLTEEKLADLAADLDWSSVDAKFSAEQDDRVRKMYAVGGSIASLFFGPKVNGTRFRDFWDFANRIISSKKPGAEKKAQRYYLSWFNAGARGLVEDRRELVEDTVDAAEAFAELFGLPERPKDEVGRRVASVCQEHLIPEVPSVVKPDAFNSGLDDEQRRGVNLILNAVSQKDGHFLLADGTGFGKTRQIIAAAASYKAANPDAKILVVTMNEGIIADSFAKDSAAMGVDLASLGIELGTYVGLTNGKFGNRYDLALFDEAHNLKNIASKRYLAYKKMDIAHKVFVTATPMDRMTDAAYFFGDVNNMSNEEMAKTFGFHIEEREGRNGPYQEAVANQGMSYESIQRAVLSERDRAIATGRMIRRAYPFLGEVNDGYSVMSVSDEQAADEQAVQDFFLGEVRRSKNLKKIYLSTTGKTYENDKDMTPERWNWVLEMKRKELNQERTKALDTLDEPYKVESAVKLANDILKKDPNARVIVVGSQVGDHRIRAGRVGADEGRSLVLQGYEEVVDRFDRKYIVKPSLKKADAELAKAGITDVAHIYSGYDKTKEQNDFVLGRKRVLLMTTASGGTGINLDDITGNHPTHMIVMSKDYSAKNLDQLLGRISRKTTKSRSTVYFLTNGSMADEHRDRVTNAKRSILAAIQGGDIDASHGMSSNDSDVDFSSVDAAQSADDAKKELRERFRSAVGDFSKTMRGLDRDELGGSLFTDNASGWTEDDWVNFAEIASGGTRLGDRIRGASEYAWNLAREVVRTRNDLDTMTDAQLSEVAQADANRKAIDEFESSFSPSDRAAAVKAFVAIDPSGLAGLRTDISIEEIARFIMKPENRKAFRKRVLTSIADRIENGYAEATRGERTKPTTEFGTDARGNLVLFPATASNGIKADGTIGEYGTLPSGQMVLFSSVVFSSTEYEYTGANAWSRLPRFKKFENFGMLDLDKAYRDGDPDALLEMVSRNIKYVKARLSRYITGHGFGGDYYDSTYEAMTDVLMKVAQSYQEGKGWDPEKALFSTWITNIAKGVGKSAIEKRKKVQKYAAVESGVGAMGEDGYSDDDESRTVDYLDEQSAKDFISKERNEHLLDALRISIETLPDSRERNLLMKMREIPSVHLAAKAAGIEPYMVQDVYRNAIQMLRAEFLSGRPFDLIRQMVDSRVIDDNVGSSKYDSAQTVDDVMRIMPTRRREVVDLYRSGMTISEVASRLGIGPEKVRAQVSAANVELSKVGWRLSHSVLLPTDRFDKYGRIKARNWTEMLDALTVDQRRAAADYVNGKDIDPMTLSRIRKMAKETGVPMPSRGIATEGGVVQQGSLFGDEELQNVEMMNRANRGEDEAPKTRTRTVTNNAVQVQGDLFGADVKPGEVSFGGDGEFTAKPKPKPAKRVKDSRGQDLFMFSSALIETDGVEDVGESDYWVSVDDDEPRLVNGKHPSHAANKARGAKHNRTGEPLSNIRAKVWNSLEDWKEAKRNAKLAADNARRKSQRSAAAAGLSERTRKVGAPILDAIGRGLVECNELRKVGDVLGASSGSGHWIGDVSGMPGAVALVRQAGTKEDLKSAALGALAAIEASNGKIGSVSFGRMYDGYYAVFTDVVSDRPSQPPANVLSGEGFSPASFGLLARSGFWQSQDGNLFADPRAVRVGVLRDGSHVAIEGVRNGASTIRIKDGPISGTMPKTRMEQPTLFSSVDAPRGIQKSAGTNYPDASDDIRAAKYAMFSSVDDMRDLIMRKRPDLGVVADPRQATDLFNEFPAKKLSQDEFRKKAEEVAREIVKFKDTKARKAALHWFINGSIRLPEDAPKVEQALSYTVRAKGKANTDPMSYKSPMEMMEALHEFKPRAKPINPDTVPELSDRRDMGHGVVTYLVQDDRKGQQAMRQVINTHWGEDANPWCLLHGDRHGNLSDGSDGLYNAYNYWKHYSALPKRVAFRNGKLLAFMATDSEPNHRDAESKYSIRVDELANLDENKHAYTEQTGLAFATDMGWYTPDYYSWIEKRFADELKEISPVIDEQWWDREDSSHRGIPLGNIEVPGDKFGRWADMEIRDGVVTKLGDYHKGEEYKPGYVSWFKNGFKSEEETDNGRHEWYPAGTLSRVLKDGQSFFWTADGALDEINTDEGTVEFYEGRPYTLRVKDKSVGDLERLVLDTRDLEFNFNRNGTLRTGGREDEQDLQRIADSIVAKKEEADRLFRELDQRKDRPTGGDDDDAKPSSSSPAESDINFSSVDGEPQDGSGVSFDAMNSWRVRHGLPPMRPGAPVGDEQVERGADALLNNLDEVRTLVSAVNKTPRALSDVETVAIGKLMAKDQQDYERLAEMASKAVEAGNREHANILSMQAAAKLDMVEQDMRAMKASGSAQGRAFRLRRILIDRNLSLAGMIGEIQMLNGRRLTEEEREAVKTLFQETREAIAKLDAAKMTELSKRIHEAAKSLVDEVIVADNPSSVTMNPRKMATIERDYDDAMKQAKVWADKAGGTLIGMPKAQKWIRAIVRFHTATGVGSGLTGLARYDAIMDAVMADVRKELPSASREEVEQALSQYGIAYKPSADAIEKQVRNLQALALKKRQLADILEGKVPLKTGYIRDLPSDEQRELERLKRSLMKELGLDKKDQAGRLQTILGSIKRRLSNQISDLERAINEKKPIVKADGSVEYDEEALELRRRRDELKKRYDETFYDEEAEHEKNIQRLLKTMEARRKAALERLERARNGDFSKGTKPKENDPRVVSARDDLAAINQEIEDLKNEQFPEGTPEEIQARVKRRLKALEDSIALLNQKMLANDFTNLREKKEKVTSPEIEEREKVREAAYRKWLDMKEQAKRASLWYNPKVGQNRLLDWTDAIMTAPRVLRTMLDLSATLTQGAALFTSHPVYGFAALKNSILAFFDEKRADHIQSMLDADPDWEEFQRMGGHAYRITDSGNGVPEEFRGVGTKLRIGSREFSLESIPGVKQSERSFGTFLNCINLSIYRAIKNGGGWLDESGPTEQQKMDLAEALNVASGYGYGRGGGRGFWDKVASEAFWAPRFAVAGIKMAVGWNMVSPFLRGSVAEKSTAERVNSSKQAAKQYARQMASMAAWTLLATLLLGRKDPDWLAEVLDPRSSNFTNVRVGNTNLNFFGPVKQWWTFMARLITGESLSRGQVRKTQASSTVGRMARGKLSPVVGTLMDVLEGKDFLGNELDYSKLSVQKPGEKRVSGVGHVVQSLGVPLSGNDIVEAFRNNELSRAMLLTPFILAGAGKNTYELDEYAMTVNRYKAILKEEEALSKAKNKAGLQAFRKANPVLSAKSRLDGAIARAHNYELMVKRMEKDGKEVPEKLRAKTDEARAAAVQAIRSASQTAAKK